MADHNRTTMREQLQQQDWPSPAFRNKIVSKFSKLEDEMKKNGTEMPKSSIEMEEYVFQRTGSREEYLDLVARVLISVSNDRRGQGQSQNPGAVPAQGSQDPIGALQNLTGQATSGMERQQDASMEHGCDLDKLVEAVKKREALYSKDTINRDFVIQEWEQVAKEVGTDGMMQGMHRMAPGRPHQMMPAQQQQQQQQPQQQQHMQHQRPQMQQQPPPQLMRQDAFMVTSPQTMPGSQGQPMVSQNTGMMYQAPGGIMRPMGPSSMPHQYMAPGMPMPSPVGGSPLTMMPSPHGVMPSPAPRPYGVVSPSANLHTPGTAVSDPSPAPPNSSQEELAYMEKLHNMSKYIEPLRKSVQEYEKKTDDESIKNYNKMTKLLDILSNPKKRVSMTVLIKCEQALMKQAAINVSSSRTNEQHMCQPLLNAIAQCSDANNLNHSLYRTFGPALETFRGSRIKAPSPPPTKKLKTEKEEDGGNPREELPNALQGEIARLGRRFQVSVDNRHHPGSQAFHLLCRLEDPRLPSVPPLQVTILKSYPKTSPQCEPLSYPGYDATELFKNVENNLSTHLSYMPSRYCLTQLLVSWEMSVRKACDPQSPLLVQDKSIFV